ncbi:MAG: transcriptional regulator [Bacteroidota bacterium]|nr:transcriptional regulator [Bacteroidota bacterium]
MKTLKYKVIKTEEQYQEYVSNLEQLLGIVSDEAIQEEIELLTLLIEKWDEEHNSFELADPIQLLHSLMAEHQLKNKDLVAILGVSKGLVSDILNYKKGLSKEIIRSLAKYFSLSQEAFNRSYKLISPINAHLRNASIMNTAKEIA